MPGAQWFDFYSFGNELAENWNPPATTITDKNNNKPPEVDEFFMPGGKRRTKLNSPAACKKILYRPRQDEANHTNGSCTFPLCAESLFVFAPMSLVLGHFVIVAVFRRARF